MSEDEALGLLASWPTSGGMEYGFYGYTIAVILHAMLPYRVEAISISTSSAPYLLNDQFKIHLDDLAEAVHHALGARRTILDIDLLSPPSRWSTEVEQVRTSVFKGEYQLDLRVGE